ncbi:MAG: glycerol-3-phosphate acyltransferase [Chloroflexi bacterium]|nr:glycerol-3-phosphate acyltransferase [Chloroflexota bacterium]
MTVAFVLLVIFAYLLGSIPTAYLIAKWRRGIDIRKYGSGNVGASNVLTVVSKRWSIPVTIFDIGKGALAVWIARLLGMNTAQQITGGIFTVVGHNWPIFLGFKGGRGIFTTLGVITSLSPPMGLITLITSYALAPVRQLSLGVFFALLSLPFLSWFLASWLGIEDRLSMTFGLGALTFIGLTRRLLVPRRPLSESVATLELFLNRLLFDRDIRDRKVWICQKRADSDLALQPSEKDNILPCLTIIP